MSSALALAPISDDLAQEDRRRMPRFEISIAVRQEVDGEVFLCQAGNINTGGMFLARMEDTRHTMGKRSWLEFSLPGCSDTLRVRAQTIWEDKLKPYELSAVRFLVVAPSHRRQIEIYAAGEPYAPRHPTWDQSPVR